MVRPDLFPCRLWTQSSVMVWPKWHVVLVTSFLVGLLAVLTDSSSSLIRPPQSVGIHLDAPIGDQNSGVPSQPQSRAPERPDVAQRNDQPGKDSIFKDTEYGARGGIPSKSSNIPPPVNTFNRGRETPINRQEYFPGREDDSPLRDSNSKQSNPPLDPILPPLNAFPSDTNEKKLRKSPRQYEPFVGEGYIDAGEQGFPFGNPRSIPSIDESLSPKLPPVPSQSRPRISNQRESPYVPPPNPLTSSGPPAGGASPAKNSNLGNFPAGAPSKFAQPNPHDYPPPPTQYFPAQPSQGTFVPTGSSANPNSKKFVPHGSSITPAKPASGVGFQSPFAFSKDLKIGQDFLFQSPLAFQSPRSFQRRRPEKPTAENSLLGGFSTPFNSFEGPPEPLVKEQRAPEKTRDTSRRDQTYPPNAIDFPPSRPPAPYSPNPRYPTQGSTNSYENPFSGSRARGQCFQYTFPAEAYRLSYLAKGYPLDAIQKELNTKPYLAPLVGLEAQKEAYNPFSFNTPISSQFDYGRFDFRNEEDPSQKYSYLKNVKSYPGNFKEGNFVGEHPVSMQPLNSACPAERQSLRSFFYHGGDCHVVNPDFQDITYFRCTRRDCNFCGVNRGLSACVETYRWTSVIAYCTKLQEMSRVVPLRLILPVGCTCQHYAC